MQLTQPENLSQGVVIINGGTQGLGEAVARKLASDGIAGLVLVGRSVDRGTKLAAELEQQGTPTLFLAADVSASDAPQTILAAAVERFAEIHGLVNVAASTARSTLFNDSPEKFEQMMRLNVQAPYFLIQATARHMFEKGIKGSIVNIGSTSGYGGQSELCSYSISKGALSTMTRNLAFALMQHGIRVNQVNPGWMETESEHRTQTTDAGQPDNWLELAAPQRPLGRLVQPWEVANAVAYCLSPASGLMTGNEIDIDQSVQGAGNPPLPGKGDTIWP